jgi:hypothetical protein
LKLRLHCVCMKGPTRRASFSALSVRNQLPVTMPPPPHSLPLRGPVQKKMTGFLRRPQSCYLVFRLHRDCSINVRAAFCFSTHSTCRCCRTSQLWRLCATPFQTLCLAWVGR